tara:strand:- start:97 stop:276 length:180 start_codon:yes stop_codon:yes gene_type:complete
MGMITKEEFEAFEYVRQDGMYNMLSPNAILMSGLDKKTYLEIVKNYDDLREMYRLLELE